MESSDQNLDAYLDSIQSTAYQQFHDTMCHHFLVERGGRIPKSVRIQLSKKVSPLAESVPRLLLTASGEGNMEGPTFTLTYDIPSSLNRALDILLQKLPPHVQTVRLEGRNTVLHTTGLGKILRKRPKMCHFKNLVLDDAKCLAKLPHLVLEQCVVHNLEPFVTSMVHNFRGKLVLTSMALDTTFLKGMAKIPCKEIVLEQSIDDVLQKYRSHDIFRSMANLSCHCLTLKIGSNKQHEIFLNELKESSNTGIQQVRLTTEFKKTQSLSHDMVQLCQQAKKYVVELRMHTPGTFTIESKRLPLFQLQRLQVFELSCQQMSTAYFRDITTNLMALPKLQTVILHIANVEDIDKAQEHDYFLSLFNMVSKNSSITQIIDSYALVGDYFGQLQSALKCNRFQQVMKRYTLALLLKAKLLMTPTIMYVTLRIKLQQQCVV